MLNQSQDYGNSPAVDSFKAVNMVFVTWDESYSVYVESIDAQHKKMMSMINDLHYAIMDGEPAPQIVEVLKRLESYTEEHFRYEEEIFDRHNYPQADEHKKQHNDLVQQVKAFRNRINNHHEKVGEELLNFLLFWLGNHIKKVDRQYTAFMLEKGIK